MVLLGKQIQRCDPASCNLLTDRALPNDIARLPGERAPVRAQPRAHSIPVSRTLIQQNGPNRSAVTHSTRYHVTRAGRPATVDRSPNGPRQPGGRYVLQIHHHRCHRGCGHVRHRLRRTPVLCRSHDDIDGGVFVGHNDLLVVSGHSASGRLSRAVQLE